MAKETDFSPVYPRVIQSGGTVINTANGLATDGSQNVNLLGRNYQEVVLFNAQAILDTILHTGTTMNINTLAGQTGVCIVNTLDQPVTVNLYIKNQLGQSLPLITGVSVPASGGTKILTDSDAPFLRCAIYQMYATAQCATAPTTGGVSVTVSGVQQ